MKDKEIKQAAEAYANNYAVKSLYRPAYDGFIAGAHSRDEEIEMWKTEIEERHLEIEKLRNAWISVEDRLPEDNGAKIVLFDGMSKDGSKGKYLATACYIGKGMWQSTFSLGTDACNIQFSHTTRVVTHWMEVPPVPRKEE